MKTGATKDGTLVANELRVVADTGAYGGHAVTVQANTGSHPLPLYPAENIRFHCKIAYTNLPSAGAMRGYGTPQGIFAVENQMDEMAERLGMDPLEFRGMACIKKDQDDPISRVLSEGKKAARKVLDDGLTEAMRRGAEAFGWDSVKKITSNGAKIRRGVGMACAMQGNGIPGIDWGAATIKLNDDGSYNVLAGEADLGTGADTVLGQMVAETLGVNMDKVVVYSGDTDMTPFDVGAYASSTTYISGTAVKKAADVVRMRLKERAAMLLGIDAPCSIELRDRQAWAPDGRSVSIAEIALDSLHLNEQEQIMGTGSHVSPDCPPPFAAQFVELEVDIDTGQVTVVKMVMAVDCGVAINPITASGQVEGGMLQALGYAHCEEIVLDGDGTMVNPSFGPYPIYRADETPETEVFLIQTMEDSLSLIHI